MKRVVKIAIILPSLFFFGSVNGQDTTIINKLSHINNTDSPAQSPIDSLEIEMTIQAGTSMDSSNAIGSCGAATGYTEEINFPSFLHFSTKKVIVNSFNYVIAFYTIKADANAPVGTYEGSVLYTVLINTQVCRTREFRFTITITPPQIPIAEFKAERSSVTEGGKVHFINLSQNAITEYRWDFGDGETSSELNPSHTYINEGKYTVSLTTTGPAGNDTETKVDYIQVVPSGTPGQLLWSFDTGQEITSAPVVRRADISRADQTLLWRSTRTSAQAQGR